MRSVPVHPDLAARHPGIGVESAVVEGLHVVASSLNARSLCDEAAARVRASRTLDALKDDARLRAYRDFYWAIGIDPTKTRPAAEALNRRVLRGAELPAINAFVDAYNAASLETGVSIGAYDLDLLQGDLALRPATAGEAFRGIGEEKERALAGGEPVVADAKRILTFFPYRDADATKVTLSTTRALLLGCRVPGLDEATVEDAVRRAAANVAHACGGRVVA